MLLDIDHLDEKIKDELQRSAFPGNNPVALFRIIAKQVDFDLRDGEFCTYLNSIKEQWIEKGGDGGTWDSTLQLWTPPKKKKKNSALASNVVELRRSMEPKSDDGGIGNGAATDEPRSRPTTPPKSPHKRTEAKNAGAPPPSGAIPDLAKLKAVIERLSDLSEDEYQFVRIPEAKDIPVSVTYLDKKVQEARKAKAAAELKPKVDLWLTPVKGETLLADLIATFKKYVIMTDAEAIACALWTLLTHSHDAFWIAPYLAAVSPTPGCGKTTLISSLLQEITANALPVSSISAAAVYYSIEQLHPTLLMDEADKYFSSREDLQGIINSAHNRRGAFVMRCVEEQKKQVAKKFSTWAPIALAWKGQGLPDTIDDRSISIRLRKKLPSEKVERFRSDRVEALECLKRKCARWAADNMAALQASDPDVPSTITNDRHADNWRTFLSIAEVIGGEWPEKARKAAIVIEAGSSSSNATQALGVNLLADIRRAFNVNLADFVHDAASPNATAARSIDLIAIIKAFDESPWEFWKDGKYPITEHTFAKLLLQFGICSQRKTDQPDKGKMFWHKADFKDAWERYLPPWKE